MASRTSPFYKRTVSTLPLPLPVAQTTLFYSDDELPTVAAHTTRPPKNRKRQRRDSLTSHEVRFKRARSAPPSQSPAPFEAIARSLSPLARGRRSPALRLTPPSTPTPITATQTDSTAVGPTFESSPLTELPESDDDSVASVQADIKKPPGEVGRPESGGYNLTQAMNWTTKSFNRFQVGLFPSTFIGYVLNGTQQRAHMLAEDKLDIKCSYSQQEPKALQLVRETVRTFIPCL